VDLVSEACSDVDLSTEDYDLENVDELSQIGIPVITDFSITGRNPYISIRMSPSSVRVEVGDNRPTERGLFEAVREHLESRRVLWIWLLGKLGWLSGGFMGLLAFLPLAGLPDWAALTIGILLTAMSVGTAYASLKAAGSWQTRIYISNDVPQSFFVRRRDEIVIALIGALLGGVVTLVASALVHTYSQSPPAAQQDVEQDVE
jgi:hypothetical protein